MNTIAVFYQTVYTLGQICLFRARPTALPYSWFMLTLFIALDFVLNVYHLGQLKAQISADIPLVERSLGAMLSILALVAISYSMLMKRNLASRLHKFLLAIFGTELMLTALAQLLFSLTGSEAVPILQLILTVWRLAVQIQIIQFTFEAKLPQAILLLLGIILAASLPLWFIIGMNLPPQP
ncbi:MAG TPA: hypothetical protein PLD88_15725 [Candidatus Berkiella sp.]|nr:hypothetical protein [Candidatus Berkiella sp.]